jgi:CBS domain-containing membrane protein
MAKTRLHERLGDRGNAFRTFFACALAMVVSGSAAYAFKLPLLFPSTGPTAFLFFEAPMSPAASPRNTLIGHFVAVVVGGISLYAFGLLDEPSVLQEGVTLARVGDAALSVALAGAILLLLKSSHPPSGATVLIVSLGLLRTPGGMISLMVGVAILTATGWLINRALGVPVPVWSAREAREETT